jgi:hypothetical protein
VNPERRLCYKSIEILRNGVKETTVFGVEQYPNQPSSPESQPFRNVTPCPFVDQQQIRA